MLAFYAPRRLDKSLQQSHLTHIRFANQSPKTLKEFANFEIDTQQDLIVGCQVGCLRSAVI